MARKEAEVSLACLGVAEEAKVRVKVEQTFPAPVRPTIPTFSPGRVENETPLSTSGSPSRYRSRTSLNSTQPCEGQSAGGS